jgi:rhodanese-related sulfurtransferase
MAELISPQRLAEIYETDASLELIDVRTPAEFREVHVTFARNVPLDRLDVEAIRRERGASGAHPLYVICRSGSRARQACERLTAGVQAVNVEGGTLAWEQAGLPVVRGKKTISLERQVRIVAGSLVLLGAVLALTVHPYFAILSALIGAGLVFAGLTDTCGMAMLLARMPWNQASGASDAVCKT